MSVAPYRDVFLAAHGLVVTPKRYMDGDQVLTHEYDRTVQIPGGGGSGTTGAREVLDWLVEEDRDFDVMGTI